jgi:hypothetical protein
VDCLLFFIQAQAFHGFNLRGELFLLQHFIIQKALQPPSLSIALEMDRFSYYPSSITDT